MNGVKIIICNVVCLLTASRIMTRAEERVNNTVPELYGTQCVQLFPGIKLFLYGDEVDVKVNVRNILEGNKTKARGREKESINPIQRIVSMLMMIPYAIQLFSLPGTIASIKMSLLRSIFTGKLAIFLLIYNFLKSLHEPEETVVVHQSHHHDHYYNSFHDFNDDDNGWLGR